MNKHLLLKWSDGNEKLKKTRTVSFNLPAIKACPMAGVCASVCYATQGAYVYPNVQASRAYNFDIAQHNPGFQDMLIHDLKLIKQSSIRIHDSGDFFNQAYLNAWIAAMKQFPDKQFYAYTKSLHLDYSAKPDNFQIVQSVGGKLDHLIDTSKSHSRIFTDDAARIAAGYEGGNKDDTTAQLGVIKIGLVYHGKKNLTENQKVTFS